MDAPKTKYPQYPWIDPNFHVNRINFPWQELEKYAGQHIAWNWDATKVLASGADEEEVLHKLEAAGIDTNLVVFDFIDDGTTYL